MTIVAPFEPRQQSPLRTLAEAFPDTNPFPASFAADTYVDNLTRWSISLELNPDNLGKSELFGVLVSVAMSMMTHGKGQEDLANWYQFSWAASEKLGRSNKRGKSNILQLTGTPSRDRINKALLKAWEKAEHHHTTKVLPDVSALRQQVAEHVMGGSVSKHSGGRRSDGLLETFDDMVAERHRLNQQEFTYPCRPAAERLGVTPMAICSRLKRLVTLNVLVQVEQGQLKGLDGEGVAHASRYWFPVAPQAAPAMGGSVSKHCGHPTRYKQKKPPCKLPFKVMKRLDQDHPLTYQTVLDHGGDVTHWKRWLRHLESRHRDSQQDRYRWVVAKNDPQGAVAVDAHQRRQELKAYEFLNRADPGAADRRRMVSVMRAHGGVPSGSKVTVSRVLMPDYDYGPDCYIFPKECYSFSTDCPVVQQMLACFPGPVDVLRGESAIRLMETYGVLVERVK